MVLVHIGDQGRLVVAGALWAGTGRSHQDETGGGTGVVADARGHADQPIHLAGHRSANRGVELRLRMADHLRRTCGRPTLYDHGVRHVGVQPATHLRDRVRVADHPLHLRERRARADAQVEADRDHDLGDDLQRRGGQRQVVQRGADPTLDRVLDRHQGRVHVADADRVQGACDCWIGDRRLVAEGQQRLMGERALWPEETAHDAQTSR